MQPSTLVVPGFRGSDTAHWQSWLERTTPSSRRVSNIDWHSPRLYEWTDAINSELDAVSAPVMIVAHSFGCLASILAAKAHPKKIAGMILVAPATPTRFRLDGPNIAGHADLNDTIVDHIPKGPICTNGLVVASRNDPWMTFNEASYWANRWQLKLFDAGKSGHINNDSGHGPWPVVKTLLDTLKWRATPLF